MQIVVAVSVVVAVVVVGVVAAAVISLVVGSYCCETGTDMELSDTSSPELDTLCTDLEGDVLAVLEGGPPVQVVATGYQWWASRRFQKHSKFQRLTLIAASDCGQVSLPSRTVNLLSWNGQSEKSTLLCGCCFAIGHVGFLRIEH